MTTMRSILITGCSSGIGHAAAHALKQRGYQVFASARKPVDVEKLTSEGLHGVLLDVHDTHQMQTAVKQILEKTGGTLDALFNNAGYLQAGAVEDLNRDLMRAQFETNVFGAMELARLVLPTMRQQGHGRIIQNSSILGVITLPYYGAYNASKFALEGFSATLRQELRGTHIHVSCLNPGPIVSRLRDNAFQHYQQTIAPKTTTHQVAYQALENTYFQPSQCDRTFMLSPEAVIQSLNHALESRHPRAHYFIGVPTKTLAFIRRLLPDSALDWLLSKIAR